MFFFFSALVTNLKYWRLTGMFYLLIMVCCGCAVSTLLRSHASSLLIPTWSGLLRISPLAWTSTHRYLPHFNSEFNPLSPNIHIKILQTDLLETIEKRRNNTVVPKSYRPKGQPRSTRNEFPIRLRKFSKTSNMAAQACEVNAKICVRKWRKVMIFLAPTTKPLGSQTPSYTSLNLMVLIGNTSSWTESG